MTKRHPVGKTKKPQPNPDKLDDIRWFLKTNDWRYYFDLDIEYGDETGTGYDAYTPIEFVKIKSLDYANLFGFFNGLFKKSYIKNYRFTQEKNVKIDNVKSYCIYKLVHLLNIKDFRAGWHGYYYGDQEEVELDSDKEFPIISLLKASDTAAIEMLLIQEYGYVLPSLQNRNWGIAEADIADVSMPKTNLYQRINKEAIERYIDEYKKGIMPTALCEKVGNKFRLIDGRHRYIAAKQSNQKKIIVIYPTETI